MTRSTGAIRLAMAQLLAWRSVSSRPLRALLLCGGFGVGVGVMIVLLAVGEAMVRQASQERLVGGGTITVLPDGIDLEVLTTGGLGGLFFSTGKHINRHKPYQIISRLCHQSVLTAYARSDRSHLAQFVH